MTQDTSGDRQEAEPEIDELSDRLSASIDRCRSLLDDCRAKLAANSNDPDSAHRPANDTQAPALD